VETQISIGVIIIIEIIPQLSVPFSSAAMRMPVLKRVSAIRIRITLRLSCIRLSGSGFVFYPKMNNEYGENRRKRYRIG
jgi:hypothetical protein